MKLGKEKHVFVLLIRHPTSRALPREEEKTDMDEDSSRRRVSSRVVSVRNLSKGSRLRIFRQRFVDEANVVCFIFDLRPVERVFCARETIIVSLDSPDER